MNKEDAINKAMDWHDETGQHASVIESRCGYEWHPNDHFQIGGTYGYIVFSTLWEENF